MHLGGWKGAFTGPCGFMLLWLIWKEGGAQSLHQPQQLWCSLSQCPYAWGLLTRLFTALRSLRHHKHILPLPTCSMVSLLSAGKHWVQAFWRQIWSLGVWAPTEWAIKFLSSECRGIEFPREVSAISIPLMLLPYQNSEGLLCSPKLNSQILGSFPCLLQQPPEAQWWNAEAASASLHFRNKWQTPLLLQLLNQSFWKFTEC